MIQFKPVHKTDMAASEEHSYEIGNSRLHIRVELPPDSQVTITLASQTVAQMQTSGAGESTLPAESPSPMTAPASEARPDALDLRQPLALALTQARARLRPLLTWEIALLGLALMVYLITRLVGLDQYPIYFFTDEAVQTILAEDFWQDGLRGYDDVFLPTYFLNSYQYNLSVSVYVQVLPWLLFGKSIGVTRGTCVLISLIAGLSVGLTLKNIFQSRYAWLATLVLSITPAWFLHSRTAFETGIAVSFYASFLYCYLMYRKRSPRYLYAAILWGGLTFYSYSPIRLVIGLMALLLFLSDLPYHWQQRRVVLRGLGLVFLLTLPLIRFQILHPNETVRHLEVLNSYWIQSIPLLEKLQRYFREYLHGFSLIYWYLPNTVDLARHVMKGYGHLLRTTLPLGLLGLGISLWKVRQPEYRAVLISLLTAPSGAALAALGITRALVMVIPAALLTTLGFSSILEWAERRWQLHRLALALPVFILLVGFNIWMLRDALVNGPLWNTDYGLGGMQWGGRQLTQAIDEYLRVNPGRRLIVSPAWANGTDTIFRFFYPHDLPFEVGSITGYLYQRLPLDDRTTFVMIPEEFEEISHNPKFTDVQIEKVLPYPNGQPGFFFIRLRYAANIDSILEAERQERRKLIEGEVSIQGIPAQVKYSYLDMGSIGNVFDGNPLTLVRTLEANPLQIQLNLAQARLFKGMAVRIGGTATKVSVWLLDQNGNELLAASQSVEDDPNPRTMNFSFDRPVTASQIRLEVQNVHDSEPAHVHLWEVSFLP